ncbi:MAG: MFS transporter, partial [Pseudolabrys sp.]
IAGNLLAGLTTDFIPAKDIIWLMVVASIGTAVAAYLLFPLKTAPPAGNEQPKPPRKLLRDPAFIAVVAAASLIQASHALFYGFGAVAWSRMGLDGTTIAVFWALAVVAEIILFAYSGRLPPFFNPTMMLIIGAAGAGVRWSCMALDPAVAALPFLQCLHALSFGATHLGALGFVARHAPPGQAATAQGYLAIAMGVVMAGAMGISGVLYDGYGSLAYIAMALAAVAGGGCALVAHRARGEAPL